MSISENDSLVKERKLPAMIGNWEEFLRSGEEAEFNELRFATRTGLPAGNADFVQTITDITGRCLAFNKPGRPRKRRENDK